MEAARAHGLGSVPVLQVSSLHELNLAVHVFNAQLPHVEHHLLVSAHDCLHALRLHCFHFSGLNAPEHVEHSPKHSPLGQLSHPHTLHRSMSEMDFFFAGALQDVQNKHFFAQPTQRKFRRFAPMGVMIVPSSLLQVLHFGKTRLGAADTTALVSVVVVVDAGFSFSVLSFSSATATTVVDSSDVLGLSSAKSGTGSLLRSRVSTLVVLTSLTFREVVSSSLMGLLIMSVSFDVVSFEVGFVVSG